MTAELQILKQYIHDELGFRGALDPDADLLEDKVLDSFNIVELALFIQKRFGVDLDAEDVVRDNLATLSGMLALITRKRSVDASETR